MKTLDTEQVIAELDEISNKPTRKIFKEAIYIVLPSEMRWLRFIVTLVLAFTLAYFITFKRQNSFEIIDSLSGTLMSIFIELFGWVFTGYSIFQALLSPRIIYIMCRMKKEDKKEDKEESKFHSNGKYYISYLIMVAIGIVISFCISNIKNFFPLTWNLFENIIWNNTLCMIGLVLYLHLCIAIFVETIYFVCNVYRMYNIAAAEKYAEVEKEQLEKDS